MARRRLSALKSVRARAATGRLAAFLALALATAASAPAGAHGFGQRYELPLPLGLYLFAAAAVVALSFLVFSLFVPRASAVPVCSRLDLLASPVGRLVAHPAVTVTLRFSVLALFVVAIVAGLIGDQNPYRNIAPTLIWIVWWVGMAFVAAFVGDLWALINPWRTLFDVAQWAARRLGREGALRPRLAYPGSLGVWPACILLLAFSWIELVYPHAASPVHISVLALGYSALTWCGMVLFGRDAWLQNGEVFSLVFRTLGRFAPCGWQEGRLVLRPFGAGLTESPKATASMVAFVLLLLATVLYDGLIGTGEWALFEGALRKRMVGLDGLAIKSIGLIALWLLFLGAYFGICAVMSLIASGRPSPSDLARDFALTLVPIAIGYHVAHYLVFLLVQGQYIVPLLSDPFGYGWNLFGTAAYRVDIAFADARFAWYATVVAIVAGHIVAIYLAHVRALAVFESSRVALRSQAPLTALMVVYTLVGLSIAAEPIIESRPAAEPAAVAAENVPIPADALLPDGPSGNLLPVGPGKSARTKLTYKVLGSSFHDGSKTGPADLLYAYAFAWRWGAQGNGKDGRYDPYVDDATADLRRLLLGVRVIGVDAGSRSFRVGDVEFVREVLTVEVYLAGAPEDPEWSAVLAPPWSTLPWTVLALMEEVVARGVAAFSLTEAERRGVPWLDLVRSRALTSTLAGLVAQFEREAFRPTALRAMVSEEEARRRWRALTAFHKANGHFLVTNGPYRLKAWTPQSMTLEAFRDLTYPLGVGSYDAYAVPRRGFVTKVDFDGTRLTFSGDIEVVEKFQRSYRLVRTSVTSVPAPFLKRAEPEIRYRVVDASGTVALAGTTALGPDMRFSVDISDRLVPGRYTLFALLAVNGNAMNANVYRMPIVVPSQR
jgi:hypothetical protein